MDDFPLGTALLEAAKSLPPTMKLYDFVDGPPLPPEVGLFLQVPGPFDLGKPTKQIAILVDANDSTVAMNVELPENPTDVAEVLNTAAQKFAGIRAKQFKESL